MQAGFHPSHLLCPATLCWVPHERVCSALSHQSAGYIDLSSMPGALEGLGAAHNVAIGGVPPAIIQVHIGCKSQRADWVPMQNPAVCLVHAINMALHPTLPTSSVVANVLLVCT